MKKLRPYKDNGNHELYYPVDEVNEEIKRIKADAEKWENVEAKAYEDKIAELVEAIKILLLLNYEPDDITYIEYTELIEKYKQT